MWQELEAEAPSASGLRVRLASPQLTPCALLVAVDQSSGARALLVPVDGHSLPRRSSWPECAGLDLTLVKLGEEPHLCLRLRDPASSDVFTIVAEDIASRLASVKDTAQALALVFNQLGRWQLFLTAARDHLSVERQRGLFGELLLAATVLGPRVGMAAAIDAWKGSASAHQDFQVSRGAIEVKSTAAKQPTAVRITSERQLDDAGVGALFLHVFVLDEREVSTTAGSAGDSLLALVQTVRAALASDAVASARFEDKLLLAGWLDAHSHRYAMRRWTVRTQSTFCVSAAFPRIVESQLPRGTGDVSYALDLAACEPFRVMQDSMLDALF